MARTRTPPAQLRALALFAAAMLVAPLLLDSYLLSVLILVLYFAYVGQAWNVMTGFAGQLSLGHSLYLGLGAYVSAALFVRWGVAPTLGLFVGMALAALAGLVVGGLGFRFGVKGVYFALLTIAFAEFTRILFDHLDWVGGASGLFLPVQHGALDPLALRGPPSMFYYLLLALNAGAFLLCHALLTSRVGYYWLAIREDPEAAAAMGIDIFRYRLIAVALSAAMTSLAGVFYAFYYNTLYPEQIFSTERSIEAILAPIVGGIGTLFGPVVGAFLLTLLGRATTWALEATGMALPGAKQIIQGLVLLLVIMVLPTGVWPWLRRRLGLEPPQDE
ncbi:MAG: branched-chain amino acid ABC transporter permease [Proteobacteria bacterium]|nr:branched-chain amino acid ABC transporter permease [Pseudomonadota bacterium]MBI3497533.1 branched-chain amino acid ABC transporter permease [Pseudomonadota bacterium]